MTGANTDKCPQCQSKDVLTQDEMTSDVGMWKSRRLVCSFCGYVWNTTITHKLCGDDMSAYWAGELIDKHRAALRDAIRSLPERVMCEDVARELVTRNDLSVGSLRVLYRVVSALHQDAVVQQARAEEDAKK